MELEGYGEFSLLGAGGNAHVYEATPNDGEKPVAVKVLRGAGDEAVNRRFERERKLMGELHEIDGVVPVLDSGVTESGDPFLVMPLYESGSLQGAMEEGPVPWEDALEMVRTIGIAVAEAHEKRILHLDIKPANVLLDEEGQPHLGDFGIAEMMGSTASMSAAMMTPAYTPPERLADAKPTEQTDVYGLGATLFALLSGEPPFGGQARTNPAAVIASVLNDQPAIDALPDNVPESAANLVSRCMAKEPNERPKTAAEMVEMLTTTIDGGYIPPILSVVDEPTTTVDGLDATADSSTVLVDLVPDPASGYDDGLHFGEAEEEESSKKAIWAVAVLALLVLIGAGAVLALLVNNGSDADLASERVDVVRVAELGESANEQAADEGGEPTNGSIPEAEVRGAVLEESDAAADVDTDSTNQGPALNVEESEAAVGSVVDVNDERAAEESPSVGDEPAASATVAEDPVEQAEPENESVRAPNASFQASRSTVEEGQSVSFTNTSSDSTSSSWSFGTGDTSSRTSPSYTFTSAGRYTVRLTASGPGGTHQATTIIEVTPREVEPVIDAPRASFTTSASSVQTGDSVRFTDTSAGDVSSASWDFGDGRTATGTSATHSYTSAGTYTVRMTSSGPGGSNSSTKTITVTAPPVVADPPPRPDNIGCQYLGNDIDVQWAFSPLPALVDTYVVEFSNGSRSDLGRQPGPFSSTDNFVTKIIAVRDGIENAASVGGCMAHGGVKPVVGAPGLPVGVRCRFHDFFFDGAGVYTWSETWNWSSGGNTDSYVMVINQDGSFQNVNNGSSTTHTTVGVNGQSNSGRSVKGIIAVGAGGETQLTISNCGAMGGTGWVNP